MVVEAMTPDSRIINRGTDIFFLKKYFTRIKRHAVSRETVRRSAFRKSIT